MPSVGGIRQSLSRIALRVYGILNGIGIDENAMIRDDPQETGDHHGRSLAACARACASNSSRMSTVAFTVIIVPRIPSRAAQPR